MSMIKYRVHEVAKDFGLPTKSVTQILTDYIAPPSRALRRSSRSSQRPLRSRRRRRRSLPRRRKRQPRL